MTCKTRRRGFSLIELVIVVVILGIIGAIAIPRMSRGSEGAAESALKANLQALRGAIDLYAAEHAGSFPTLANFETQLTQYTDATGATSATKTGDFIYGPYLRSIPPLPVGTEQGSTDVTGTAGEADHGWVYDAAAGTIISNTGTETNGAGTRWDSF
ncbi:MAG: prepilin-type N-terminal cleavage/methylation domain-containing protein [Planctomycetota bacterium]